MAILAVVLTLVSVNSGGSVVVWRGDGHVDLCGVWCGYRRGGSEMWWVDIRRRGGDGWWWAYWSDDTGLRWIGELTMTDSGWIEHGWWSLQAVAGDLQHKLHSKPPSSVRALC
jgi:hypothetical protein